MGLQPPSARSQSAARRVMAGLAQQTAAFGGSRLRNRLIPPPPVSPADARRTPGSIAPPR